MADLDRTLMLLVRAHAPAATTAGVEVFDMDLELRGDLGFDQIALAELAIAIEDAFGIAVEMADLDECRTVWNLQELVAAKTT